MPRYSIRTAREIHHVVHYVMHYVMRCVNTGQSRARARSGHTWHIHTMPGLGQAEALHSALHSALLSALHTVLGLGQAKAADGIAHGEAGQPALLLRVAAERCIGCMA